MDELTPQQKNDLIAEKIMGWKVSFPPNDTGSYESRFYDNSGMEPPGPLRYLSYEDTRYPPDEYGKQDVFNPCGSLDDCFLAEEKMTQSQRFEYIVELNAIICEGLDAIAATYFAYVHATPMQKVNAMLKAIQS